MTTTLDSIHERCCVAIATEIRGLRLPVIADVYDLMIVHLDSITLPCVAITIEDTAEEEDEWNYRQTGSIYPVNVLILDDADTYQDERRKVLLGLRKAIVGHLQTLATLPNVPECWNVEAKYANILDSKFFTDYQKIVSSLTARCHTLETRPRAS